MQTVLKKHTQDGKLSLDNEWRFLQDIGAIQMRREEWYEKLLPTVIDPTKYQNGMILISEWRKSKLSFKPLLKK